MRGSRDSSVEVDASVGLVFSNGVWRGTMPSVYGEIEFVLDGTPDVPKASHLDAIKAFMPTAGATIERLRRRLPLAFLWRPIRLAPNNQDRVGVQFQRRLFSRREILFADT
jgi:hypothetical protein